MAIRTPHTIDEYIGAFAPEVQDLLNEIRQTVKQAAPDADETIKYGMPTFVLNGSLAYFAVFKNHIGFYPVPTGVKEFEKDMAVYKTGRGSIQFPLNKPMPLHLITRMVQYRAAKNLQNKVGGNGN